MLFSIGAAAWLKGYSLVGGCITQPGPWLAMTMLGTITSAVVIGYCSLIMAYNWHRNKKLQKRADALLNKDSSGWKPLPRSKSMSSAEQNEYDLLIIGGGASGAGCALDAAARGLRVILIDRGDFGAETSSKCSKLLHGGIRYLDKAVRCLSICQLRLVLEALAERYIIMRMMPYLTAAMPIMVPVYRKWTVPYYWLLLKLYDKLSGLQSLGRSCFISKKKAMMNFAKLKKTDLVGAMVYKDGVFDDARANIMLVATSEFLGATVLNHVEFKHFEKDPQGRITAAICAEAISGSALKIRAKGFISATGAFTDVTGRCGSESHSDMMVHSAGTHAVYPAEYGPEQMGLLDTNTADGRVMFILPWKGKIIAGSTETRRELEYGIAPTKEEVEFLHREIQSYLGSEIDKSVLLAAWCALRPLVCDGSAEKSECIVRSHSICDTKKGLILLTGGKWTTFRLMAEQCIDLAVRSFKLKPKECCMTQYIRTLGSTGYAKDLYYAIQQALDIELDYAQHLLQHYGARAYKLKEYLAKYPARLSSKYQFRAAEVIYCIENEYALTVCDILNNRFRLGCIDVREAARIADKVGETMAEYFSWPLERKNNEHAAVKKVLASQGLAIIIENEANA